MLPAGHDKGTTTHPLYPYDSVKLVVIFVYGTDFTRHMNIVFVPESIQTLAVLLVSFMSSATFVLYLMRRKLKLRRNGLTSTFIDIIIAFIAGGNLRVQHKLERSFFGILLIGVFFLISLVASDLLDCVYRILNQRISTFEQLTKINSSIYIKTALTLHKSIIREMLRFVEHA